MKTLWILAVAAVAATAVLAARPAGSSQTTDCGATIEIRDPELRTRLAELDRNRNAEMAQICAVYRDDRAARTLVANAR